ncbi:MAG: hypothetical protein ACKPFD_08855 [Dolichospermum sp.]
MKNIIGLGLVVLSVYLYNTNACFAGNKLFSENTQITEIDSQLQVPSDRSEQTGDCIRKGLCKD